MANDERKAQLSFAVDATGVKQGLADIKRDVREMTQDVAKSGKEAAKGLGSIGDGAPAAQQKVDGASKSIINSIQRTTAALDAGEKGSARYFEVLAKQRGINGDLLEPYLQQLRRAEGAQKLATGSLGSMEMSAKATAAALRGVPAQFTDIVTSLQGGQAPLTVFLQQGGQLKDMFGGAGNAARALGGYVVGLVNPFTLAAGAVATLGLAYYKGSQEADAYRKALVMTGNAAGTTAGEMQAMAAKISGSVGTQGNAADALAQLAGTGEAARANLLKFGEVAVAAERNIGTAVADTVKHFAELGKSPVEASLKLNEQYRYLTASVYEQIRALRDQGRQVEAANLAQTTYASAMASRADELKGSLGSIERAWRGIAGAAKSGWDAMLNVGRQDTAASQLEKARADLEARQTRGPLNEGTRANWEKGNEALRQQIAALGEVDKLERRNADASARKAAASEAGIRFSNIEYEARSKQKKLEEEIARVRADGALAGKTEAEIQKAIAIVKAQEKYQDSGAASAARSAKAEAKRVEADALQAQIALYKSADKSILDSRQDFFTDLAYEVKLGSKTSVQALGEGLDKEFEVWMQRSALLELELAAISKTKNSQKEQQVIIGKLADVQRDYDQAAKKAGGDIAVTIRDQTIAYREAQTAAQAYVDTVRRQNDRDLSGLGRGNEQREQDGRRNQRDDQYQGRKDDLLRQRQANQISETDYAKYLAIEATTHAQVLAADEAHWARRKELQGDWSLGASEALRNYADESANVYRQTESLMTTAFSGMEDALVKFATTGKLSFSDLATSIIADMIRIQARAAMSSALSSIFGAFVGSAGGVGSAGNAGYGNYSSAGLASAYGYSSGGYTGTGDKHAPAGIVHKGEVVWSQADVRKAGGVGVVEAMRLGRPGLANGGIAGPAPAFVRPGGGGGYDRIIVNNYGKPQDVETQQQRNGNGGMDFIVTIKKAIKDEVKGELAGEVATGRGSFSQALTGRYPMLKGS